MTRQLSITTDFNGSVGDPAPSVEQIAKAGFSHVHWCHGYTGLKLYKQREINYIRALLRMTGLKLLDVHASDGRFLWGSTYWVDRDDVRELIENRFRFTAELGGRAIVLHAPVAPTSESEASAFWSLMDEDLGLLTKWAIQYNIKVALEQTDSFPQNLPTLVRMLDMSDPEHIGFCWDTGHGNIHGNNRSLFGYVGQRLYALHFNDNPKQLEDPKADPDIHQLPFDGTVDWDQVISLLRDSSYEGPLSFEVSRAQYRDHMSPEEFLKFAFMKAAILDDMLKGHI